MSLVFDGLIIQETIVLCGISLQINSSGGAHTHKSSDASQVGEGLDSKKKNYALLRGVLLYHII